PTVYKTFTQTGGRRRHRVIGDGRLWSTTSPITRSPIADNRRGAAIAKLPASHRVRVILATRTLVSYVPVWRATVRALAELGCAPFFIGGVAWTALGSMGPWAVLGVALVSVVLRAADVEARALFVSGGLYGSVRETLGQAPATLSASALLVD